LSSAHPAEADSLPPGAVARLGSTRFRVSGHIAAVALSPDGKTVAVYEYGWQRLTLFDVPTGKVLRRFDKSGVFGRELTFSPDGKYLVSLPSDHRVTFLDVVTGKRRKLDRGRSSPSMSLLFSADGKRLAARDETGNWFLPPQVWDVATGKILFTVENDKGARLGAALSANGQRLASWDRRSGREILLWDVDSGKEAGRLAISGRQVVEAAFSPDGKSLAVAEFPRRISFWDLASGKEVAAVEAPYMTGGPFRFSPDGKLLVARTAKEGFAVWDVARRKRLGLVPDPEGVPRALVFPAPGKAVVAGVRNQSVCLWELPSGRVLAPGPGHRAGLTALEFLPDGKTLCSAGSDGVRWWDLATRTQTRYGAVRIPDRLGKDMEIAVRLSPGARYLGYVGGYSDEAPVHVSASLEELFKVPVDRGFLREHRLAFSADRLVSLRPVFRGNRNRADLSLRDLAARKKLCQLEGPGGSEYHAALTPDGRVLALLVNAFEGQDARQCYHLRWWDPATGREIAAATQEEGWAEALALSLSGEFLATAEQGGDVWLWHVRSGRKLLQLEKAPRDAAHAARFSPDGRTLAVGVSDLASGKGAVLIWEVITGKLRLRLEGHRGAATALAFSPDGRRLATGGADTTVLLWDRTRRPGDKPLADRIAPKELDKLWETLKGPDAVAGHRAVLRLAAAPADAVPLLARHLKPVPGKGLTAKEIAGHIADLDADTFAARERATEALAEAGPLAEGALRKALDARPSPEKALRLRRLLEKLNKDLLSPGRIRPTRALEVLERIRTPEARDLLRKLARGAPHAWLTREARAALGRMGKAP
jgi:WD40 repeat protein